MTTATTFSWDTSRGDQMIAAFGGAPSNPVAVDPHDFSQGCMTALVAAELLAAQAGLVAFVPTPSGDQGVVAVGTARNTIYYADPVTRSSYLAVHGAVAKANSTETDAQSGTSALAVPAAQGTTIAPLVVLAVIGVAAIIAGAAYLAYTQGQQIQVDGQNLRAIAATKAWADQGRAAMKAGVRLPDSYWSALGPIVNANPSDGTPWWQPLAVGTGLIGAGVAGSLLLQNRTAVRRSFRR